MRITTRVVCVTIIGLLITAFFVNSYVNSPCNYPDAYIVKNGNHEFIKLKGRRKLIVHDLFSLLINKTYEDSTLLPILVIEDGIIRGNVIPVEKGDYKFDGTILIKGKSLIVHLYLINTDDNTLPAYDWNGKYNLIKSNDIIK
ncbi:MAG: hypothetical protein JWQ84_3256 [Mucilaginibacter sp.]|nr:hypothetical protein [Mucilaginibacter sp.]